MKAIDFNKLDPIQQQYMELGQETRSHERSIRKVEYRAENIVRQIAEDSQLPTRKQMSTQDQDALHKALSLAQDSVAAAKERLATCVDQRRIVEIKLLNGGKS